MNKILIVLLIIGAGALGYLFLGQEPSGDTGVLHEDAVYNDMDAEGLETYLEEDTSNSIAGSCNSIPEASTCVEYRGSMWAENDMAELNCSDAGIFSTNGCPYSAYGGCQTGGDTVTEMTAWMYKEGGGGIDDESIQYAIMACNSNPMATWVYAEDVQ